MAVPLLLLMTIATAVHKEDQQGIGQEAPLLEKLRLQYSQSSQDPKPRQSWTGEPAQYIFRSRSQQKMTYRKDTKTVLYRSKMNPTLKRNFAVFPVLDWIAAITAHIPNKGEQLIRYYGTYSNVSRGKRKKEEHKKNISWKPEFVEVAPSPISKELKRRWSHFIQKV